MESCSVITCQAGPTKKIVERPGRIGRCHKLIIIGVVKMTARNEMKMSSQIKNQFCTSRLSIGGLLAFLRIRALLGCIFEADQNPRFDVQVQAGFSSGLNLCSNLPTVQQQCYFSSGKKAGARHFGVLRPSAFRTVLPYARGKPRAPSGLLLHSFKFLTFKNTPI